MSVRTVDALAGALRDVRGAWTRTHTAVALGIVLAALVPLVAPAWVHVDSLAERPLRACAGVARPCGPRRSFARTRARRDRATCDARASRRRRRARCRDGAPPARRVRRLGSGGRPRGGADGAARRRRRRE